MIFEALYDAAKHGELLLIEGGMCHWHLRRDGEVVIREIIATVPGAGTRMLEEIKRTFGAQGIIAKCPADLGSNDWYAKKGFYLQHRELTKTGREINVWRLAL